MGVGGGVQTCAATAAQVMLWPLQQASSLVSGFSPLQLHVGDVPLKQQQIDLLLRITAHRLQQQTMPMGVDTREDEANEG